MACSIAENQPLLRLAETLGVSHQCHSTRPRCVAGLSAKRCDAVFGIPGAAIGYCQALFNYAGASADHTAKVKTLLREINAPWSESHELFWGYRCPDEHPIDFLTEAIRPLLGSGRVPVVISALDPAADMASIKAIFATRPEVHSGETVLLRLVLSSDQSISSSVGLIRAILDECRSFQKLPRWWPLIQGELSIDQWRRFRKELEDAWQYINVAVNPFTQEEVCSLVADQITVAQVPIGSAEDISMNGYIRLAEGMKISGASPTAEYSLDSYVARLSGLATAPTIIILGPSLPSWSDAHNQDRIAKLLPLLRQSCDVLWDGVPASRRNLIWKLAA